MLQRTKQQITAYINFLIGVLIWITFNNIWTNSVKSFGISKKYNIYISIVTFILLTIYIFTTDNPPSILTAELTEWSKDESSNEIFDDIDTENNGVLTRKEWNKWVLKYIGKS